MGNSEGDNQQLLAMLRGVFYGSNGIGESSESSDAGVDLENSGGHCLRQRRARRLGSPGGSLGPTFNVLKTHPRFSVVICDGLWVCGLVKAKPTHERFGVK